jgi:integron integrase
MIALPPDPPGPPASSPLRPNPPRLLDRVRDAIRLRHYSPRTEDTYVSWIRRFIFFHGIRHPAQMGAAQINQFLTDLAVNGHVSASTQNQAFSALLFLYQQVLHVPLEQIQGVVRANRARRLPVVLSREEVWLVFSSLDGVPLLVCSLLYGAGLQLFEALSLRVKDVDFLRQEVLARDGKGQKDQVTMLPAAAREPLLAHLDGVRRLHERDLSGGLGRAPLPDALARKYPGADREWGWQWVFPASSHYVDRRTGMRHRYHVHESVVQRAVKEAVGRAGLAKPASCHTFRDCFATHLLEDG